jgi:hypothetical protein
MNLEHCVWPILKGPSVVLSEAWASNAVNTMIFRHHAILTRGRFQYGAYYRDATALVVFQRELITGKVDQFVLEGNYNLVDAHNSISLGIDRDHHLHMSYDQHASKLRYRKATLPGDIFSWGEEQDIEGETALLTYPTFLVPDDGRNMMLLSRNGHHNKGEVILRHYEERTGAWSPGTTIISGMTSSPWTSNAYWNHPAMGRDGSIHLGFVWRSSASGPDNRVNNINLDYAKSLDDGKSWISSRNRTLSLPITQVNSETAWAIAPESNLINQAGMALDSEFNPHIVFYSDDENGIVQYQHVWLAGDKWRHSVLSTRTSRFVLAGGGTLRIPISRPDILVDDANVVYVIYRGDLTGNRLVAQRLLPPHYTPDQSDIRVLWKHDVGMAEPIIDRLRWRQDRILSMLVQWNDQPDRDAPAYDRLEPILTIDLDIVGEWEVA